MLFTRILKHGFIKWQISPSAHKPDEYLKTTYWRMNYLYVYNLGHLGVS